jgi:hypothetical protein
MKRVTRAGLMTVIGVCSLSVLAQETQRQASANVSTDCKEDLQTFCKNVDPGGGRLLACLQANYERLAANCKSALTAAGAEDKPPAKPAPSH